MIKIPYGCYFEHENMLCRYVSCSFISSRILLDSRSIETGVHIIAIGLTALRQCRELATAWTTEELEFDYQQEQEISCQLHIIPSRLLSSDTVGFFTNCKSAGARLWPVTIIFVLFYPFSILKIEFSIICLSVYPPTIISAIQLDASTEGKSRIFCFLHPSSIQNPQQYCICYCSNRSRDSADLKLWSCTTTLYICTAYCAFVFYLRMRHSTSSVWASCEVELTFVCRRLKV